MTQTNTPATWPLAEDADIGALLERFPRPLEMLAAGDIAAIVLRNTLSPSDCQRLIDRLVDQQYLYDPTKPIPDKFIEASVPEGYFREGKGGEDDAERWRRKTASGHRRIDIGTSLGYRGSDREQFFTHSAESRETFDRLFADDEVSPIELCYRRLEQLSVDKRVKTAEEADGRRYCPAIIRAHYGGYTYKPHFDSVRNREKRTDYAVNQFDHQFAGVLVLQNTQLNGRTAQCVLHRCFWSEELEEPLANDRFHEYAAEKQIPNVEVALSPGDLYFFNTGLIHEVPGVAGELPRVVLASFIGFSSDREDVYVWS